MTHPANATLASLQRKLRRGELTPTDIVKQCTARIEQLNPRINALLSWNEDAALAAAAAADVTLPLGGLPLAVKDNICTRGEPLRCASRMLAGFHPPYHATAVNRLLSAGAIPYGRANMDEFAMGSSGTSSAFGPTLNPADETRIPGGSSSGSAAAVAAGMLPAALGSDTGGSVRQPASHCGVVGLKPTYGRISRYGLVAFASSLDQIGTLTVDVEDAALLLNILAGHDEKDSTSSREPTEDYTAALHSGVRGLCFGIPKEYMSSANAPEVTHAIEAAVHALESAGAHVRDISLPHAEAAVAAYYIIACAEASSNLSRFDGTRYGYRAAQATDPDTLCSKTRAAGFGEEVKRRIILGTYVLSGGYYEAYYARAQKVRAVVAQDFARAFAQGISVILGPVAPTSAPPFNAPDTSPLQTYLADIYTVPANLAGLPAISVPYPAAEPLPVGVQLSAPAFGEVTLLRAAEALEQTWKT